MVADMAQAQDPLALKEQGNGLFKSGEYKGAADFYSQVRSSQNYICELKKTWAIVWILDHAERPTCNMKPLSPRL